MVSVAKREPRRSSQARDMFSRVVANCSAVIGIDPRPVTVTWDRGKSKTKEKRLRSFGPKFGLI